MSNGTERIKDLLSAPMEAVIIALGVGIATAQRELDLHAIEMQREINEDPLLSEFGFQPTFYQIPKAELELNIAIAMEDKGDKPAVPKAAASATVLAASRLKQLHLQPVNATYTNQFNYNVQASSKLKLTFVPVPPATADTAATPRMTRDDVMNIAGPFLKPTTPNNPARLAVNFNGQGRLWFVLQYQVAPDNTLNRLALVVIDDDTGTVVKHV
jgi:hypothetical protein